MKQILGVGCCSYDAVGAACRFCGAQIGIRVDFLVEYSLLKKHREIINSISQLRKLIVIRPPSRLARKRAFYPTFSKSNATRNETILPRCLAQCCHDALRRPVFCRLWAPFLLTERRRGGPCRSAVEGAATGSLREKPLPPPDSHARTGNAATLCDCCAQGCASGACAGDDGGGRPESRFWWKDWSDAEFAAHLDLSLTALGSSDSDSESILPIERMITDGDMKSTLSPAIAAATGSRHAWADAGEMPPPESPERNRPAPRRSLALVFGLRGLPLVALPLAAVEYPASLVLASCMTHRTVPCPVMASRPVDPPRVISGTWSTASVPRQKPRSTGRPRRRTEHELASGTHVIGTA